MKILVNGNTLGECFFARNNDELNILDRRIGFLKKNNKIEYMRLVFLVAMLIIPHTNISFAMTTGNYTMFDDAGMPMFELLVSIAKWVFIAKGGWEVIQKMATGCDIGDVSSIITKYGMGYGTMILLPKILNMLGNAVGKINI